MYKKRIGIWVLFVIACLIVQTLTPLIPSTIINIKQSQLDRELQSVIEELAKVEEEVVETGPIVDETIVDGDETVTDQEAEATEMFGTMLSIIAHTAQYIGMLIVIYGIMSLMMGFMREDAEQTSRAITMTVTGAVLIGFKVLLPMIFGTTGS